MSKILDSSNMTEDELHQLADSRYYVIADICNDSEIVSWLEENKKELNSDNVEDAILDIIGRVINDRKSK